MRRIRVLVINEPRAYREVIAAALNDDPRIEAVVGSVDALDDDGGGHEVGLVICSHTSPGVDRAQRAVLLYPDGLDEVHLLERGRRSSTRRLSLAQLRDLVVDLADEASEW